MYNEYAILYNTNTQTNMDTNAEVASAIKDACKINISV